jgi:YesN/AraC family two-component response regulator
VKEELKENLPFSRTLKVLFVEDNQEVQGQLLKLFKNFFSNIDTANDGEMAFLKYQDYYNKNRKYYDLVITDLRMPGIDGIELCKKIMKNNLKQKILVVSAYCDTDNLKQLIEIGVFKYLQKPIDHMNLIKIITSTINKIREEKKIA